MARRKRRKSGSKSKRRSRKLTAAQIRAGFGGKAAQSRAGGGKRRRKSSRRRRKSTSHAAAPAHRTRRRRKSSAHRGGGRRKGRKHHNYRGSRRPTVRAHRRRTNPMGMLGNALKSVGISLVATTAVVAGKVVGRVASPIGKADKPIDAVIYAGGLVSSAMGACELGAGIASAALTDAVAEPASSMLHQLGAGSTAAAVDAAKAIQGLQGAMKTLQGLGAVRTLGAVQATIGDMGSVRAQMSSVRAQMSGLGGLGRMGKSARFTGARGYLAGGGHG